MTHCWLLRGELQPRCPNCGDELSVKHVLVECDHYAHIRNRTYPQTVNMTRDDALRCMLAEKNGKYDLGSLVTFLTETGLYQEI